MDRTSRINLRYDMARNTDVFIGIAAALAAAAYILSEQDADASVPASSGGSLNGFQINNPMNLRYIAQNPFRGQTGNYNGYGEYDTLSDGVRAGYLNLTNDYFNIGLNTLNTIIPKYAPASDNNNVQAYVSDVANRMGIAADEPIAWPQDAVSMVQAIVWHEQGQNPMSDTDVAGYINS